MSVYVLRPIRESDRAGLRQLVDALADSLTTLPRDEGYLEEKIHQSLRAFYPRISRPGGEHYLFGLEEVESGRLVGTSGLLSRVGGHDPFYTYEIRKERVLHAPLKVDRDVEVLHLKTAHKGPAEVASLLLHPEVRGGGLGRLLSLGRFLFLRSFPQRFEEEIIAEMRGYIDETGTSPFWEAVGRVFFQSDFHAADLLSGLGEKDFIAALMPRYPIYVPILPQAAREAIGRVHPHTEPALRLLLREGFVRSNEADIFDAGPMLRSRVRDVRVIRETRSCTLGEPLDEEPPEPPTHLVSNTTLDFRCLQTAPRFEDGGQTLRLGPSAHAALAAEIGSTVDFAPLKPVSSFSS